ncbi:unnamed protein product [Lactuca saligna]|uniref:CCHC-type domain-containing protein n=1 Tax=Lactuca saligna TaxID=75948 RepID=A0AA35Z195_LACSI|nr:unnamed protein product [Lactuca saligna]
MGEPLRSNVLDFFRCNLVSSGEAQTSSTERHGFKLSWLSSIRSFQTTIPASRQASYCLDEMLEGVGLNEGCSEGLQPPFLVHYQAVWVNQNGVAGEDDIVISSNPNAAISDSRNYLGHGRSLMFDDLSGEKSTNEILNGNKSTDKNMDNFIEQLSVNRDEIQYEDDLDYCPSGASYYSHLSFDNEYKPMTDDDEADSFSKSSLSMKKSDPTRFSERCQKIDYAWRIHASIMQDGITFEVKKMVEGHTLTRNDSKGKFTGVLAAATGIDSNNSIFPITYYVLESESTQSWTWFLESLKKSNLVSRWSCDLMRHAKRVRNVLDLLDAIRENLMKWFDKKRVLVKRWNGVLLPNAKIRLNYISKYVDVVTIKLRHKCPRCGEYGHREKSCKNPTSQSFDPSETSMSTRKREKKTKFGGSLGVSGSM